MAGRPRVEDDLPGLVVIYLHFYAPVISRSRNGTGTLAFAPSDPDRMHSPRFPFEASEYRWIHSLVLAFDR
jgi:hypothetical protein